MRRGAEKNKPDEISFPPTAGGFLPREPKGVWSCRHLFASYHGRTKLGAERAIYLYCDDYMEFGIVENVVFLIKYTVQQYSQKMGLNSWNELLTAFEDLQARRLILNRKTGEGQTGKTEEASTVQCILFSRHATAGRSAAACVRLRSDARVAPRRFGIVSARLHIRHLSLCSSSNQAHIFQEPVLEIRRRQAFCINRAVGPPERDQPIVVSP
jgi:hypothetical protein